MIKLIEKLRKEMEDTSVELGIDHPKVLKISQRLDELLNQFEEQKTHDKKSVRTNEIAV